MTRVLRCAPTMVESQIDHSELGNIRSAPKNWDRGLVSWLRERRMDRSFLLASFACLASHATRIE